VCAINTAVTSKGEILETCRAIVSAEGMAALSMRHVAEVRGVALGSLYHYFSSKDEMITATVESVWRDIFHMDGDGGVQLPLPEYVRWLFSCVREGAKAYPNFSMAHSVSFASSAKAEGRETMQRCFSRMKEGLARSLEADPDVRPDAFSGTFSRADFVDFVFSAFLSSFVREKDDCAVLAEVIRRTVYR